MTSEERKRIRYLRRCSRREIKKAVRALEYDYFDTVFSFKHMWKAYKLSRRGVSWKKEVAEYIAKASLHIHRILKKLKRGKFKSPGFNEFWINERGKKRFIQAVRFFERVIQRCLCDYCLNPALLPGFIRDNWASQKGKGYHDAIKRIRRKIAEYIRKNGMTGYVMTYDFKDFFASLNHHFIKEIVANKISDKKLIQLIFHFVDCFGKRGLGLGSQVSQILALSLGDKIDHALCHISGVFFNGRYMDDGIIIAKSKAILKKCKQLLKEMAEKLHLTLNEKKTHIIKMSHGFSFLKKRFSFRKTNRIIMKISRKSITHERLKLKKLIKIAEQGIIDVDDIFQNWNSWKGYAGFGNSYHTIKRIENELYLLLSRSIHRIHVANSRQKHGLLWRGRECV